MRLRAQVLMFGLVWLCVNKCHTLLTQHCDTGKANLEIDLFPPDEFLCPNPRPVTPALQLLDVSTKYSLQPAVHVCMDLPITYNHTIPNSGAHRPVGAQSGEYLYCPPQRWINNLKDGATVLLFHPCASEDARRSLAAVAHSCLTHFILTAHPHLSQHRPFALVSWGHTLEMSHITRAGVCEWLLTFSSNFNQTTASRSQNYNLYLTKAAPVDRVLDTAVKLLKACCLEALSAYAATSRARKSRSVQQPTKRKMEKREMEKEDVKHSENPSVISSMSGKLNHTHTQTLNNSESKDLLSMGHVTASLHTAMHSEERAGDVVDKEVKTSSTQMKSLKEPHGNSRSNVTVVKLHDSQIDVKSPKKSITVASGKQRIKTDVVQLSAGEGCTDPGHCGPPDVATAVIGGPLRGHKMPIQRTNEAVWAAAALGFLLVLLTLSVLHTRLYRNCRAPSSLYWRESHQDYESVADIIRRRLRMVGRRKRRASQSRRQECPLLSDSSTDDD